MQTLVPQGVVAVETREELLDIELFASEQECLGQSVDKRRREFVTGRACARRALARLGVEPTPIASGDSGQPLWPPRITGSITHCAGYWACAVARTDAIASVGIDAEPHAPLPRGVLEAVSSSRERARLAGARRGVWLDRVLFSAKEAVYKAWFELAGARLRFEDVDVSIDPSRRTFLARLLVPGARPARLRGNWRVIDGLVLTAIVVAPAERAA